MFLRNCTRRPQTSIRLAQMASHFSNDANGAAAPSAVSLADLPKSNVFTSKLPPDSAYPTPEASHKADRRELGPRMVKGALYTYVRPEPAKEPELLGVSERAMRDIGIKKGEEETQDFKEFVAGNKIFWEEEKGGIYPWAQCYGGWQFGSWAGQLGDGRAISLFESTNPETKKRCEIQLKGAGRTPYSRFADGKAVLRSSIREYVISEALNALNIPTTRALSLTLLPHSRVHRETTEPGAIVARFAESWIRIGTFDILRARSDRQLIRKVATYVAEDVIGGWDTLPSVVAGKAKDSKALLDPPRSVPSETLEGVEGAEENRFARLYREIARRNAKTVAAWQAYAFTNGVLNTDNTSIMGLSLDFGPFAFLDNFDPNYTPNHDDHMLRYSYRNQPTIIWWNLVRLGESLGELIGAGDKVDEEEFREKGVREDFAPILVKRAETIIDQTGEEYQAVFLDEYKRLMSARLGLKSYKESDFEELFSELLDRLSELELDFNHFFRRLSSVKLADIDNDENRKDVAKIFFHAEGVTGIGNDEESAKEKMSQWLARWRERIIEDWGTDNDTEREKAMKAVNPKFIPRSWVLDEVIDRTGNKGDREILGRVMHMSLNPFEDSWGWDEKEEERLCGDVPRFQRAMMCSCSS
jgi:serine/tyrosine/threonine adenylyltransferase